MEEIRETGGGDDIKEYIKLCELKGIISGDVEEENDLGETKLMAAAAEGRSDLVIYGRLYVWLWMTKFWITKAKLFLKLPALSFPGLLLLTIALSCAFSFFILSSNNVPVTWYLPEVFGPLRWQ